MSQAPNGSRMTSLDAAFYHLERTGQLLHVGGVYTVEGAIDFERLLTDLAGRMHLIPRYTERVVSVPLNLAHPTWEPDPHFDIRHHVLQQKLRPPGGDEQLVTLVSRLFAQPLNRSRPLWELHQIDGYREERSVIFAKVHHCMIDGVSGVQLLGVMFDPSPTPAPVPPPEGRREAPALPTPTLQLLRAVRDGVQGGLARVHAVVDLARNPGRALAELRHAVDAVAELGRMVWTTFSLNEVKAVKDRLGGTVNDVVLSTISAALRAYLERAGQNPDRIELRAMLPVNVRRSDEHLKLGNRVSMLVAPLPVRIFDPLERLRQVRAATAHLKERGQAARFTRVLDLMDLLPAAVQKPLGWLQVQGSPINTVCTNIPGPPVSLYVQGKRLEKLVPVVPLTQGVGLAFAILSYCDTLTIGITADPALVPNSESLCDLLQAGFDELRVVAGVERAERRGPIRPERQRRPAASPSQVA